MNYKKTALSLALASALTTLISSGASQAATIDMDFEGLFLLLDPAGNNVGNTSKPYYYDSTWGYGERTQISGSLTFDSYTGYGSMSIMPFEFFNGGPASVPNLEFKVIANSLMLGNMHFLWNGSDINADIVFNASGLLSEVPSMAVGNTYDATTCALSGVCALPATDGMDAGAYNIGPVNIATSTYNVAGSTGYTTTLNQLSLGTDDGIGGSPESNGPTSGFNPNFDITSVTVTNISAVPVPAAVWLFASGLLGLVGLARRRRS